MQYLDMVRRYFYQAASSSGLSHPPTALHSRESEPQATSRSLPTPQIRFIVAETQQSWHIYTVSAEDSTSLASLVLQLDDLCFERRRSFLRDHARQSIWHSFLHGQSYPDSGPESHCWKELEELTAEVALRAETVTFGHLSEVKAFFIQQWPEPGEVRYHDKIWEDCLAEAMHLDSACES